MPTTYVQVAVPEDRLHAVYGLLSDSPELVDEAEETEEHEELEELGAPEEVWDEGTIREHLLPASETIRRLAKYLASRPNEEVTTDEAAGELGLPHGWNSLAGSLGAFGRYCVNRDLPFPWDSWYGDDGRARMRMHPRVAELVRALL